jgi:transcription antitermination factor NusG
VEDGRRRAKRGGRRARAAIEKGARVRVLDGPFSGKVGIVQELDGKGGARVMLGLFAVRVRVRDLGHYTPGRTRPLLSVSHRKPATVRS